MRKIAGQTTSIEPSFMKQPAIAIACKEIKISQYHIVTSMFKCVYFFPIYTCSVFPRPISSAMRQRPPLRKANLTPSCWKGKSVSSKVLGSFVINSSTFSSDKCSGLHGNHRPEIKEWESLSTTLNVPQGISSTSTLFQLFKHLKTEV